METKTPNWLYGEKAALAKAAGLSKKRPQQEITDFIAGRKNFSVKRAQRLEAASYIVRGPERVIPAAAWLRLEQHPALVHGAE
jgi:hypothetical protein